MVKSSFLAEVTFKISKFEKHLSLALAPLNLETST